MDTQLIEKLPPGMPGQLQALVGACIERAAAGQVYRTDELRDIALVYEGGQTLVEDEGKFPCPAGTDYNTWQNLRKRLLVVVNLLKASVRDIRARVYGGGAVRELRQNPYLEDVQRVISGTYPRDMRAWFTNWLLFGTAGAVPILRAKPTGEITVTVWLPDPCFTYAKVSKYNPNDYEFLCELSPDGKILQFVSEYGEGVVDMDSDIRVILGPGDSAPPGVTWFRPIKYGFFPGVLGHAQDRRNKRDAYSSPPMKDSVRTVLRATDTLFNGAILQKLQTKGILGIYGRLESNSGQPQDFAEMMRAGVVTLAEGGRMEWAVPESRIPDTVELLTKIVQLFAVIEGLPVDSLDPTSQKGTAAAVAERMDAPVNNISDEYAEAAGLYEQELILKITALIAQHNTGEPVDLEELRGRVDTEISLLGNLLPGFTQDRAQTTQMLVDMGAMTPMDAAKMWNRRASPKKLAEIAAQIEEARQHRVNTERMVQDANTGGDGSAAGGGVQANEGGSGGGAG